MKYRVLNHNGTLLGEFENFSDAYLEAQFYRAQTNNAAYIEEIIR
jgi:hypothetical protein